MTEIKYNFKYQEDSRFNINKMIAEKLMLFRCEIRNRSLAKKMQKIRFYSWLQNSTGYDELLDSFLFLIAKCKFSQAHPQMTPFYQLLNLIELYHRDWNAFILICQQMTQMNLISLVCEKIGDLESVCRFIQGIVLNRQYQQVKNQQWKIAIRETHQNLSKSSCFSILTRMMEQMRAFLKQNEQSQLTNRVLKILAYLTSSEFIENQSISSAMYYKSPEYSSISLLICDYIQDNCTNLSIQSLQHFIRILSFLESIRSKQYQKQSKQQPRVRDDKILSTISLLFHNIPQFVEMLKANSLSGLVIQLLTSLAIQSSKHMKIIHILLAIKQQSQCETKQEQIKRDIQVLNLLYRISYGQQWICYAHIQKYISYMINKITEEEKISQKQRKSNIFIKGQSNFFIRHDLDALKSRENLIISILVNTVLNEHIHNCDYDYYQIMEQISEDLISANILQKWCSHWKIVENMQYLMEKLLSIKKENIKIILIQKAANLLGYKSVNKDVKKKIRLCIKLYREEQRLQNVIDYYQYEGDIDCESNQSDISDESTFNF